MANPRYQQLFEENPKRFLTQKPPLPRHKTVMVWGPPLSGKTTYAKKLAENLGVPCLDVNSLLDKHLHENTEIGIIVCFIIIYMNIINKVLICEI